MSIVDSFGNHTESNENMFSVNSTCKLEPESKSPGRLQGAQQGEENNRFNKLVFALREFLGEKGLTDLSPSQVQQVVDLMVGYKSDEIEWKKYSHFDPYRYTRNLVDDGNGRYNLLVLAWGPGQQSPIHDHSKSHCVMKVLKGNLIESQFDWPEKNGQMMVKQERRLLENQGAYIHDSIGLHRVRNASATEPAVSLHLYTPPHKTCTTFCEESGNTRCVNNVIFHSIHGQLVNQGQ